MKKRILALLLTFALAVGLLAGCGTTATNPTSGGEKESKSTEAAPDKATEPSTEETKVVDEKDMPVLKMLWTGTMKDETKDAVMADINAYLMEKLGCKLEVVNTNGTGAAWKEKYPLVLSSGEQCDLMFSASWSGFLINCGQNAFLELSDLLEEYGQGILETLPAEWLDAATVNGKLYAIPQNKDIAQGYALYMDKEVLNEAGVKVEDIKTINDLEPVFEYIKENKDYAPLVNTLSSGKVWLATDTALEEGFSDYSKWEIGFDSWEGLIAYNKAEDKFMALTPENSNVIVDAVKLMNKWAKAGYFREDIIASGGVNSQTYWKEGKNWLYVSSNTPGRTEKTAQNTGREVVEAVMIQPIANTDSMQGSLTVIPSSSKYPELAMQIINLLHTDEYLINLFIHGKEGVTYNKVDDKTVERISGTWGNSNDWLLGNQFIQYDLSTQIPGYKELLKEYNDNAPRSELIGFSFDSSTCKTEYAAINSIYAEYKQLFWTGAGDADQYLNEYFSKLEAAGLDKVVDEYNKQYAEWKAVNNK